MSRTFPSPFAAALHAGAKIVVVAALGGVPIVSASCAGASASDDECEAAIDCGLREACRDGRCIDDDDDDGNEGEGEGEGEGEQEQRAILTDACAQLIECSLSEPPIEACVVNGESVLEDLRSRESAECQTAADALLGTFTCAATEESCEVLADTNDGGLFAQSCPAFVNLNAAIAACDAIGEGEGEGEGEPPPDGCQAQSAFTDAQTDGTILAALRNSGETSAPICEGTAQAVRLLLDVGGDVDAVTGGFSSTDGITAVDLLDIVTNAATREVSVTACLEETFVAGDIAVALIADGLLTNSVCGFVEAP